MDPKNSQVPQNLLQEFIDMIESAQSESNDLNKKIKFYQRELLTWKSENQRLQLENDKQFRQSVHEMHEQFQNDGQLKALKAEMAELEAQFEAVKEENLALMEDNEEILAKLASQDAELAEKDELQGKMQSMQEELENSQKACEYYQNDVLPEIRTETDKLKVAMTELTKENNNLRNENSALKGSNDDKMKHLENENSRLQQLYDQTLADITSAKR